MQKNDINQQEDTYYVGWFIFRHYAKRLNKLGMAFLANRNKKAYGAIRGKNL